MEHAKFVERSVKAGYALSLSCTFPLLMFSLKEHLFSICGWGEPTEKMWRYYLTSVRVHTARPFRVPCNLAQSSSQKSHTLNGAIKVARVTEDSLFRLPSSPRSEHLCTPTPPAPSPPQFAILAIEFVLSIKVPNITVAFGVIGSTVAVLIGFVIPAWVAIGGKQPGIAGWALLVGGVLTGVVCFSSTIYGM